MKLTKCFEHIFENNDSISKASSLWKTVHLAGSYHPRYYSSEYPLYQLWHPGFDGSEEHFNGLKQSEILKDHMETGLGFGEDVGAGQRFIDHVQNQDWFKYSFPAMSEQDGYKVRPVKVGRLSQDDSDVKKGSQFLAGSMKDAPYRLEDEEDEGDSDMHPFILLHPNVKGANNKLVLLHELAHIADENDRVRSHFHSVPDSHKARVAHGPSFRGNYIHIVHHVLGEKASQALRDGYRANGLKWNFNSVDPESVVSDLKHERDTTDYASLAS